MTRVLIHPATIIGLAILLVATWCALVVGAAGEHMVMPMLAILLLAGNAAITWTLPDRPAATSTERPGPPPQQHAAGGGSARGRRRPASRGGRPAPRHLRQVPTSAAGRGGRPLPPGARPARPGAREVSYALGRASIVTSARQDPAARPLADTLIHIAHTDAAPAS